MDIGMLRQEQEFRWVLHPRGAMRVPGILFASEELVRALEPKVLNQLVNVAALPGIVEAAYVMPDVHWGYGFPIGGVAALDPAEGGVVSAGGVGFDIACGVRVLVTSLCKEDIARRRDHLADVLFGAIPAGIGQTGAIHLTSAELNAMLTGGARWAVQRGYGTPDDLTRIEHGGVLEGARPEAVSDTARKRQTDEMGTLGSGNHYLEVQVVERIMDPIRADGFDLQADQVVIAIHCGSRGLGHQVATDYTRSMVAAAGRYGIAIADRELACAPITSREGQDYLGAMRAAANCAQANRQILGHMVRAALQRVFPGARADLLYDVSHNLCCEEEHIVDGRRRRLFVHRKGATRAFGPGAAELPPSLAGIGQPVLVGGTMGTASYILAGIGGPAWHSACHGAGRQMSRSDAGRRFRGDDVVRSMGFRNIAIRGQSNRGIAEEAPGAYKDVDAVIAATAAAGLAAPVARLAPLVCIKG